MLSLNETVDIAMAIKGYNKKKLAEKIKMSPSAFTDFLNGKTSKLDITKAQKIARVLDCTLDYLVGNDTINLDIGPCIKKERDSMKISSKDLSEETKIPELIILKYEQGEEEVSEFLLRKICDYFSTTILEFMVKYDLYDEYIPEVFNGDVEAYESFKKAERADAMKESSMKYPELKDIVEKGMYVVEGTPARRSYKFDLDFAVERIYGNPKGVWFWNENRPGDLEACLDEYILVIQQYGSKDLINELKRKLKENQDKSDEEKLDIAVRIYFKIFGGRE